MNKRLSATIQIGGAITGSLKSALGTTRDKLQEIGGAVRKLEREQRLLGTSIQTFGRAGKDVDGLRSRYAELTSQIGKARREQEKLAANARGKERAQSGMAAAGVTIGAGIATLATLGKPIRDAVAFETAMLGVAKQVDGARDKSGKLTQVYFDMAKQVQQLGTELPMATNDIAEMVAAGARMGVARDELIDFTRTAGMMATAFDLPAGDLADQMGKVATLFKLPIPRIGELADAINYLDDNAISNGADIIEVMKRIGGTAEFVKMPAKEAAALASTFLTLGSSAEVAGTAANAAMRELSIASMQPKRFQEGLAAIGLNAGSVQQSMAKDATGTILKVLDALNKLSDEKKLTVATQLFGKEYGDDLAKLAGGVDEYRRQLELARSEDAMGSMLREHQARLQTTAAQWQIFENRIGTVSANIGGLLLPKVNGILGVVGSLTTKVGEFADENPRLVSAIGTAVAAMGGLTVAIGAVKLAFHALKLVSLANPVGLVIGALVTGAALVIEYWQPIKGFFVGIFESIKATATTAIDWVLEKIRAVGELWGKTKAFFGFGGGGSVAGASSPSNVVPLPSIRSGSPGGMTYNNTVTAPITINQLPGQSSKELADEVARKLAERQAVQRRGAMFDHAMGY